MSVSDEREAPGGRTDNDPTHSDQRGTDHPADRDRSQRRRLSVCSFAALLAIAAGLHVPGLVVRLFNSDEASIATMATVIDHGGTLYHEIADRKPPAVPYIYAAVFKITGSRDIRPVRALGLLILALTAWLLSQEARRRYGDRAARWCGALFLIGYVAFFPGDTQAATFELFMLLPLTAAVVAAGRGRAVQAGLWLALACLCKQTAATTILPVAYLLYRSGGWSRVTRSVLACAAALMATALALGPSQFLLWTVTGNIGYVALRGSLGASVLRGMGMTAAFLGLNLAIGVLCVRAASRRQIAPELWLWVLSAAVGALAGLRFFGHYYLPLLPPMALVAAGVVPSLTSRGRRLLVGGLAVPSAVMVMAGFVPLGDTATLPYRQVALRIRAVTDSDDTVFIWGDFPEVYWQSGRQPATRLIHVGFVTGNTGGRDNGSGTSRDGVPGAWSMLRRDLATHPPSVIVDTTNGFIRQSEYYPLSATPLWRLVADRYRLVATVDGSRLYVRAPSER